VLSPGAALLQEQRQQQRYLQLLRLAIGGQHLSHITSNTKSDAAQLRLQRLQDLQDIHPPRAPELQSSALPQPDLAHNRPAA
jgi:hypothetical protein